MPKEQIKSKYRTKTIVIASGEELPKFSCKKFKVRSMPTNAGYVWFKTFGKAAIGDGWPLDIGETTPYIFTESLDDLSLVFENSGDKVAILFERMEL